MALRFIIVNHDNTICLSTGLIHNVHCLRKYHSIKNDALFVFEYHLLFELLDFLDDSKTILLADLFEFVRISSFRLIFKLGSEHLPDHAGHDFLVFAHRLFATFAESSFILRISVEIHRT